MPFIEVYVDNKTAARLHNASKRLNRSQSDLAECALAEYLLDYDKRFQTIDEAKKDK